MEFNGTLVEGKAETNIFYTIIIIFISIISWIGMNTIYIKNFVKLQHKSTIISRYFQKKPVTYASGVTKIPPVSPKQFSMPGKFPHSIPDGYTLASM